MTTQLMLDGLGAERLTARDKGLPERAWGLTVREFLATEPRLSEFWTPLIALDDAAMRSNVDVMSEWAGSRGLSLMPHGKTTMAPVLWQRQLDAGSAGITLATMGQVRTAREFGLADVMLANSVIDARSLRWLVGELVDPDFRFVSWVDSIDATERMQSELRAVGVPRRVDVCVELGAPGGRTGARTVEEAREIAQRVASSDVLRLAGVAGYEGALGHDRSPTSVAAVRAYLVAQLELHNAIGDLYDDRGDIFVTAGGSAYFDLVAEVYADAIARDPRTRWTLRSGAYIVHDDGFYRGISPLDGRAAGEHRCLVPAMRGYGRVISRPEPGLALLDGGKRDFPFDEGLPEPHGAASDLGAPFAELQAATVSAMNDQHSYLRFAGEGPRIGDVVSLGLSHPCTAFDKWRYLPVVSSREDDRVVELIRTFF